MEYGKIISITGMSGLFELVGSKKDGAIVKSLDDKSTKFVSSRVHNFSHLESIEVYTVRDNVNLVELLQAIQASGEALPDQKDAAAIKAFFEKVYPDMDFERVYASDMKKMVKWYSVLKDNQVELKLPEVEEEEMEEEAIEKETPTVKEETPAKAAANPKKDEATTEAATTEEKPVEKPAAKKAKAVATEATTEESAAEAPKKKAPRKKKTEEL
jgi:type IV secretory pathway VirB10-like protein